MNAVARLDKSSLSQLSSSIQKRVLFRVQHLHQKFGGQKVLDGVSVELSQGEVVLLRGDNGSGKTTLLNILTGNLAPDAGVIELFTNGETEEFRFPRRWLSRCCFTPEKFAQSGIGRTWQDIRLFSSQNLLDNLAIAKPNELGENPALAVLNRGLVQKKEQRNLNHAQAMLGDLGLAGREFDRADKVSLGQSKRVAIARAIQANARILFLDEPLSGLDAAGIASVMDFLKQLAREYQVTLVIVDHVFNLPYILDFATTVWTLEKGKLRVESPAQVKTELSKKALSQNWIKKLAGQSGKLLHQALPGGAILSTIITGILEPEPLLSVENLVVYRDNRLVIGEDKNGELRGISFKLYRNQPSILQAPNGWGKTTLMEAIAGLLPITQGTIKLDGKPIEQLPVWERVKLGLSFLQSLDNTYLNLTVREALMIANIKQIPFYIEKLKDQKISNLSGGEKQKVAVTCTIEKGNFLFMDEPFLALDEFAIPHYLNKLMQLQKQIIFIAIPQIYLNPMFADI